MTRQIIVLTILIIGLSCNPNRQESKSELTVTSFDTIKTKAKENIRFDFSAAQINTFKETIEIKASLFNDNTDTVYFLSSSCYGEQYSLHYDTAKFVLTSFINCNASVPTMVKIAPKGQCDFQAHFRLIKKQKLGWGLIFTTWTNRLTWIRLL